MTNDKREHGYLCSTFPGDISSTSALLAFLAQHRGAGWVFDVIDAADRMDVVGARELAAAIRDSAKAVGAI